MIWGFVSLEDSVRNRTDPPITVKMVANGGSKPGFQGIASIDGKKHVRFLGNKKK